MLRIGAAAAACFLLAGCGGGGDPLDNAGGNALASAALDRACASKQTYDRLKELAFDEAARIRGDGAAALDRIAGSAIVRMENPVVRERDAELNVTVCAGRFILELPPGSENVFDGERRLSADVRYAAQTAADGSGLVYQMAGAEPVIYRLATVGGLAPAANPAGPQRLPKGADTTPAVGRSVRSAAPTAEPKAPAEPALRAASARPSFDCRSARARSERMVCGNGSLASLDRRMSSVFYSALAQADNETRVALRRSRDRFLAFRDRCGDEACVAQAYRDRMDEIADISNGR